jgi:hypothetical protein
MNTKAFYGIRVSIPFRNRSFGLFLSAEHRPSQWIHCHNYNDTATKIHAVRSALHIQLQQGVRTADQSSQSDVFQLPSSAPTQSNAFTSLSRQFLHSHNGRYFVFSFPPLLCVVSGTSSLITYPI